MMGDIEGAEAGFFIPLVNGDRAAPPTPLTACMSEKDPVRIVNLQSRPRAKSGPQEPQVGQMGTILLVIKDRAGNVVRFIVESHRPDGTLAWVADFVADEIEVVRPADNSYVRREGQG
jgi:hypothetical protein